MSLCFKNAILCSFSLVICLQFIVTNAKSDLIEVICSKTPEPHFCLQQLKSDPHYKGANYSGLAGILLNKVEPRVNSMKNVIDSLLRHKNLTVNQQLALSTCVDSCNGAIVDVSWCKYALRLGSGDFKGLKSQAFSLLNRFKECDRLFKESHDEPVKIKEASKKIQVLCKGVLVISKLGIQEHPFDVCSEFNCGRI